MSPMTMLVAGMLSAAHPGELTTHSNQAVQIADHRGSIAAGGCYGGNSVNPTTSYSASNCPGGRCPLPSHCSGAACSNGRCGLYRGTADCPNGQCGLQRPAGVFDSYRYPATRRLPTRSYPANPTLGVGRGFGPEYRPRSYQSTVPVSNARNALPRINSSSVSPFFD